MFRDMRRNKQSLSKEKCEEILQQGTSGVLAVLGDADYPYAVPLSYVYTGNKIYFHSAVNGHKLDAVKKHNKVSFCVIAQDQIIPEKYTTYYRSVIAFGKIRILEDKQEKRDAVEKLALKYAPDDPAEKRSSEINRFWEAFCMMEMTVEHLTGKEAKELAAASLTF